MEQLDSSHQVAEMVVDAHEQDEQAIASSATEGLETQLTQHDLVGQAFFFAKNDIEGSAGIDNCLPTAGDKIFLSSLQILMAYYDSFLQNSKHFSVPTHVCSISCAGFMSYRNLQNIDLTSSDGKSQFAILTGACNAGKTNVLHAVDCALYSLENVSVLRREHWNDSSEEFEIGLTFQPGAEARRMFFDYLVSIAISWLCNPTRRPESKQLIEDATRQCTDVFKEREGCSQFATQLGSLFSLQVIAHKTRPLDRKISTSLAQFGGRFTLDLSAQGATVEHFETLVKFLLSLRPLRELFYYKDNTGTPILSFENPCFSKSHLSFHNFIRHLYGHIHLVMPSYVVPSQHFSNHPWRFDITNVIYFLVGHQESSGVNGSSILQTLLRCVKDPSVASSLEWFSRSLKTIGIDFELRLTLYSAVYAVFEDVLSMRWDAYVAHHAKLLTEGNDILAGIYTVTYNWNVEHLNKRTDNGVFDLCRILRGSLLSRTCLLKQGEKLEQEFKRALSLNVCITADWLPESIDAVRPRWEIDWAPEHKRPYKCLSSIPTIESTWFGCLLFRESLAGRWTRFQTLSAGTKQIVQELAALAFCKGTVLFDDPTVHENVRFRQTFIQHLRKEGGDVITKLVATHFPEFLQDATKLRIVHCRKENQMTTCFKLSKLVREIKSTLTDFHLGRPDGLPSIIFANAVLLVEGTTDCLFTTALQKLSSIDGFSYSIVQSGGKTNMPLFASFAKSLDVPAVILFDSDALVPFDNDKPPAIQVIKRLAPAQQAEAIEKQWREVYQPFLKALQIQDNLERKKRFDELKPTIRLSPELRILFLEFNVFFWESDLEGLFQAAPEEAIMALWAYSNMQKLENKVQSCEHDRVADVVQIYLSDNRELSAAKKWICRRKKDTFVLKSAWKWYPEFVLQYVARIMIDGKSGQIVEFLEWLRGAFQRQLIKKAPLTVRTENQGLQVDM